MANSFKTLSDGDIARIALDVLHNKLVFVKTINTQYDDRFARGGGKNGGTILIREPNQYTVRDGAIMDIQDQAETTQSFTVATQRGVDMQFSSVERTMSVDDFTARFIEPAMCRLAADIEATTLASVYKSIYNQTGTGDTTPAELLDMLNANARLTNCLAPSNDRHALLSPEDMATMVNSVGAYFHKASEVERGFSEGYIGKAANLKWWESTMLPTHTNGTRTDTTPVVNTSTGITSGSATIPMTAFADGTTYAVGDIFTIDGVWAANLETGDRLDYLQQFTVTTAETETGSGDMSPDVTPIPITSGAKQNIDIASAGAGKVVLNLTGGGSGAASGVKRMNMAYQKDFCTFATVDLHIEEGKRMSRALKDGISLRLWTGEDIRNDKFPTRIDVLFGHKVTRPEWATRLAS